MASKTNGDKYKIYLFRFFFNIVIRVCSFFSHRVNLCVCARVLRICHDKKQNVALKIKSQTEKSRTKISSPSTFISSILCCCYCHCYSYCHCCCCCCCSLFLILCIYHFLFFNLSRLDTTLWLVTMVSDRYACGWHFGQQKTPFDIFYLVFILRSLGISLLTLSIFFSIFFLSLSLFIYFGSRIFLVFINVYAMLDQNAVQTISTMGPTE